MNVDDFISRWSASGGSERANFQQFAIELTQVLGVPAPKPATADAQNDDYRLERPVTFIHTGTQSRGFIDLYRRAAFVMEAKQGTDAAPDEIQLDLLSGAPVVQRQGHGLRGSKRWDDTMLRARNQADGYGRGHPRTDRPAVQARARGIGATPAGKSCRLGAGPPDRRRSLRVLMGSVRSLERPPVSPWPRG